MNRLRLLFGAVVVMLAVLVPTGSAAASEAPAAARMGPTVPAGSIVLLTGFYCPGATAPMSPCMPCRPDLGTASCPAAYKAPQANGLGFLQITNHANYGEHCVVALQAGGHLGNEWIDEGDNSDHLVGNILPSDRYMVRCQRRAATGDAGIGGYLWVHTP